MWTRANWSSCQNYRLARYTYTDTEPKEETPAYHELDLGRDERERLVHDGEQNAQQFSNIEASISYNNRRLQDSSSKAEPR